MKPLSEPMRRMLVQIGREYPYSYRIRDVRGYPPAASVLNALCVRGLVKRSGYGQYQLTPEGKAEAERLSDE